MSTSLWEFASSCYQRAGVADLCLTLQDRAEADVNMLLSAAWLARTGRCWRQADVIALVQRCSDWRERCVLPLREVRRYLKSEPAAVEMYAHIKALELDAERHQLQLIETELQRLSSTEPPSNNAIALEQNLRIYLETLPLIQAGQFCDEIAALTQLLATAIEPL